MDWVIVIAAIAAGLFFSAFFCGTETGLYCANRVRVHLRAQQGDASAKRLTQLLSDESGTLMITLLGVNVADFAVTTAVAYLFLDLLNLTESEAESVTIAVVSPVLFIFANVIPKNLFQSHADGLMAACSRLLHFVGRVLAWTGILWCFRRLADFLSRLAQDPTTDLLMVEPKRKIATFVQESMAGQVHAGMRSGMVERVLQLSEISVQSVMVSASRVVGISASAGREELIRVARNDPHSRLPVFGGSRRQVVGLIHIDELLALRDWTTVGSRVEPAMTIGPYETVASALSLLQSHGQDMAVVAEKGGSLMGIVTLRTLLELLLGGLAEED